MLDKDLATLYGVETKVLNQTVKRNIERFPNDFRFELSREITRYMGRNVQSEGGVSCITTHLLITLFLYLSFCLFFYISIIR